MLTALLRTVCITHTHTPKTHRIALTMFTKLFDLQSLAEFRPELGDRYGAALLLSIPVDRLIRALKMNSSRVLSCSLSAILGGHYGRSLLGTSSETL